MDSLIYCLTQAMATLEQYGQHHEAGYMFNGMGEHALSAIRRHSPATAEELRNQAERCRALSKELSDRVHGPPVPAGRAKSSIVHDGREFALTPAGTVTCDGVVTEFRVVRYPRACVVVQTPYPRLAYRTHQQQDMLKMALYDVALLLAERGDGTGQVTHHPSSGHQSPIPVAKSYRPKPVGKSLDQAAD